MLARALGNLWRNATRYASAAGPITVAADRQGEQVKLCVNDCGPGVPEEALHKIFDPFYRLEADRARTTGGAGLGLAIVKTCIETCHGSVAARNLKPFGFEIAITLNAAANYFIRHCCACASDVYTSHELPHPLSPRTA